MNRVDSSSLSLGRLARYPVVFAAILSLTVIGCKNRDDREDIRNRMGPPEERVVRGADPFWSETWYYYEAGVAFEFHRSAPKCGGGRDYYLYIQYIIGANGLQEVPRSVHPEERSESILSP